MATVLLWDVMGTLVHDPFYEEMPEFFGLSFQELLTKLQPGPWVEFELGRRTEAEFLRDFFADRRDFDHDGFVRTVRDAYRWLPGMEALLADLHASGPAMHTFSNYPEWYQMIEDRLNVSRFARWSFVSCLIGHRKPDPAAYAHVVRALEVAPEDCVFIDDRTSNCEAAREAGLRSIRFEGVESTRNALRAEGVL
jgi:HAD superfamily hydrolase (TIGR01509 family)